ncbi:kinesin-related [Holotrichia oblita]|uniref:Kinesin-related n=1 Tax=Holotrichia oblita TaxID=644536 RepID=A0ACB9SLH3_HOLOL|nr:kinesin-related [Holotrichia oblita]
MKDCTTEIWDPNEGPALPKSFTFDSVYDQNSYTENIYNDICYPLVESVLEGYNSTIFVYGQTGCGKSFTMEGNRSIQEKGVISRAFEHIFEAISVTTGVKYLALASYLEIYNEQISVYRDLLLPSEKSSHGYNSLSLKELPNEGLIVPGLTMKPVHNITECEELLNIGSRNRMIGATLMNQSSSRSHSIFTVSIEQISSENNNESIKKGKLNLVDLAGSERQTKTGATGDRLKEATKINLSLSALGNVISALVDGKAKHIPYRDSKLTRLLQDSLGGNTRTLMIACVSPASRDYVETLSTLRYANRAKNIYNKPRVNEDPKDTMLRQYQTEIERLKQLLESRLSSPLHNLEDLMTTKNETSEMRHRKDLDAQRDDLIRNYETEMAKLKDLHENEKNEKESILKQIDNIREEYKRNIDALNEQVGLNKEKEKITSKEEILKRIEVLKASMIGGEKANDKELSERRRKKKAAAERRLRLVLREVRGVKGNSRAFFVNSAIAHILAKIEMNEDREILQNQYKDISQELELKSDILRKYRYKVKALEKDIRDLQSEFESEREDYLETIRKQDMNIKLLSQISERMAETMKKECNYRDLESIKEQAVWLEDSQKFKLPEVIVHRTKLPPAGRYSDIQTAPARLDSSEEESDSIFLNKKLEKADIDDIIGNYFKPKRAAQLLNQSSRYEAGMAFNTWRDSTIPDYARRRQRSSETLDVSQRSPNTPTVNHFWVSNTPDVRKHVRLDALPSIDSSRKSRMNAFDLL